VWGYLLIAPLSIGLGVFYLWPIVQTIYLSFTASTGFGDPQWTGLSNYAALFTEPDLPVALVHTILFTVVTVVVGTAIATVIAVLLNQKGLRGRSIYRVLYFVPVVTLPVASGMVWRYIFNGDFGLVNQFLGWFGIKGPHWLADPNFALWAVIVVSIWMGLGTTIVIILAGLQTIPVELYEAAELDGAGGIRQFFSLTLPLLTPSLFFVSVLSTIAALQVFDLVYVMVGPTNPALPSSITVVFLFYQQAFLNNQPGAAAATAIVLMLLIGLITLGQFRLQKRWVNYV